jgi:hypothetical protein
MDFPFSEEFKTEAKKYNFKYKCIDCSHFNEPEQKCSFEYPTDQHNYFYVMDYGDKHVPRFSFCKHFEINA